MAGLTILSIVGSSSLRGEEEGSEGREVDGEREEITYLSARFRNHPRLLFLLPPQADRQLEGFPHAQHSEPADFDLEKRDKVASIPPLSLSSSLPSFVLSGISSLSNPLPSPLCNTFALSSTRVQ